MGQRDRTARHARLTAAASLAVTAGVFAWLFSRITWTQVAALIRGMDLRMAGLFVLLSLGHHLVRTARYRLVLRTSGLRPGFGRMFLVVLVRGFCVDLLPARAGELVYLWLLKTRLGIGLGAATASFALPFLFDIMALGPLVILAVFSVTVGDLPVAGLLAGGAALFLCAGLGVALLPFALRLGYAALSRSSRAPRRVVRFLAATRREVLRARRAGAYGALFAMSVAVRLLKYGAMYALLRALLAPAGYAPADLPPARVFLGFCAAEMAASLPVSGIAGFGAYEGAWALVFRLLGFAVETAKLTAVSHHLLTQIYGYTLGLLALTLLLVRLPVRTARIPQRRTRGGPDPGGRR